MSDFLKHNNHSNFNFNLIFPTNGKQRVSIPERMLTMMDFLLQSRSLRYLDTHPSVPSPPSKVVNHGDISLA